ncbi:MAG: deiodinase [Rhodospirillaceae bacterium]|nr:deiodinase [Rhodospirillaceae bacterium]
MRLDNIAKEFGDRVHFLCVYIKEAHPTDGSQSPPNIDDKILYAQPTTEDERAEVAAACMLRFNFSFPMVLDNMTNEVEGNYKAMPERLYMIDADGRVTWKCGLGPHLFDPDGFEEAVRKLAI